MIIFIFKFYICYLGHFSMSFIRYLIFLKLKEKKKKRKDKYVVSYHKGHFAEIGTRAYEIYI